MPTSGYEWVQCTEVLRGATSRGGARWLGRAEATTHAYLTDRVPVGTPKVAGRSYNPLAHTGLFREFAELEPTPDAILAFASKYGSLGPDVAVAVVQQDAKPHSRRPVWTGESLDKWRAEIVAMSGAVGLWWNVQSRDTGYLKRHIRWVKPDVVMYVSDEGLLDRWQWSKRQAGGKVECIAAPDLRPDLLRWWKSGDVVGPALHYVQRIVNKGLERRVAPRLLWDDERTTLGLHLVPNSLIGALWLQCAQAINGNKEYRQCEECRSWFEVSLEANRTSRRYCSDACRFKAYRGRQAEARRLHADGMTERQIATRLQSSTATVKRWVRGAPRS